MREDTIPLKQYDTATPITQTLTQAGAAINLSGATVTLLLLLPGAEEVVERAVAIIGDETEGNVQYQPVDEDVENAGHAEGEWKIVYPGPKRKTVPTETPLHIKIFPALG